MPPRLPLAIVFLLFAALSMAGEPRQVTSGGSHDMPDDFCVTLRESSSSLPHGHYQTRLRVCARDGKAELVRVDDYPEIFDDIHRRVVVAAVSAEAMRGLFARVGSWQPGRWQEQRIVDGEEAPPPPAFVGGGSCHLGIVAKDVGRSLDCTGGTVQAASEAEKEETLGAIRALIPAADWQEISLGQR